MASLIEELTSVLEDETKIYEELYTVSMEKTSYIIANNLEGLMLFNTKEQEIVDKANNLGHRRDNIMTNIAEVLNMNKQTVKVSDIIALMNKQPEFQKPLSVAHDNLLKIITGVREVNEHNRELITNSLDMTEVSINLLQSINQAPETANYGKGSYNGGTLGVGQAMFDTKQ